MTRIAIIGPGAIGSLLGARLFESGFDVFLVDRRKDRSEKVNKHGIEVRTSSGARTVMVPSFIDTKGLACPDLAIISVKCRDTGRAASQHESLIGDYSTVLTLQNGLGNITALAGIFGSSRVVGGVTTMGANEIEPGVIHHAGEGLTAVGTPGGGESSRADDVAAIFESAGMETKVVSNLDSWVWRKVLVNAAINPVTALLEVRNGEIASDPNLNRLVFGIVEEGLAVATALGVDIGMGLDEAVAMVMDVAQKTAENRSSMLMDRVKNKLTEIDCINGALVAFGEKSGLKIPVNRALVQLVKALERHIT